MNKWDTVAEHKTAKYAYLGTQFLFQPIAVESLGPMHELAWHFLFTSVAISHLVQGMTAKAAFYSSTFQFCCTALIEFCFCQDWWSLHFSSAFSLLIFDTPLVLSKDYK